MVGIRERHRGRLARCTAALAVVAGISGSLQAQTQEWFKVDELRPDPATILGQNHFGTSVSLQGNHALVGAEGLYGGLGTAYLYAQHEGSWHAWIELVEDYPDPNSGFGKSVALGDGFAFVGAPDDDWGAGSVHVFEEVNGTWRKVAQLQRLVRRYGDGFGTAIAVSDTRALVSAPGVDQVHVYERQPSGWVQTAILKPSSRSGDDDEQEFGASLSFDDDVAVIGAPESRTAHVFQRSVLGWVRGPVIPAPDGADHFGQAVALSRRTLFVGAPQDRGKGRVFVYGRDPLLGWVLNETLAPNGLPDSLEFGAAVGLKGGYAVVGAPDTLQVLGNAVLYERSDGVWYEETVLIPDLSPAEGRYGSAVAIDRNLCLVNVGLDDSGVIGYFGAIHVWLAAREVGGVDPKPEPR